MFLRKVLKLKRIHSESVGVKVFKYGKNGSKLTIQIVDTLYQTVFVKIKNRWFQIGGLMFGGSWDLGAPLGFEIGREKIEPRTTREIRREFSKAKIFKNTKTKTKRKILIWREFKTKMRLYFALFTAICTQGKPFWFDFLFFKTRLSKTFVLIYSFNIKISLRIRLKNLRVHLFL